MSQKNDTLPLIRAFIITSGVLGAGSNFIIIDRDATTPILQPLGTNGISYATYAQA